MKAEHNHPEMSNRRNKGNHKNNATYTTTYQTQPEAAGRGAESVCVCGRMGEEQLNSMGFVFFPLPTSYFQAPARGSTKRATN